MLSFIYFIIYSKSKSFLSCKHINTKNTNYNDILCNNKWLPWEGIGPGVI